MKLGPYLLGPNDTSENGIYTGDARELAEAIPNESVDLIFTDPVYQNIDDYRWLAETAARVLKQEGNLLVYYAQYHLPAIMRALGDFLVYRWMYVEKRIGSAGQIWSLRIKSHYRPVLWYTRDSWQVASRWVNDFEYIQPHTETKGINHRWNKNENGIKRLLNVWTDDTALIFDPFTGGGTVPAVCKMLGRRWLAFEINPDTADAARKRVRQTQPPLEGWVDAVQQIGMFNEQECQEVSR